MNGLDEGRMNLKQNQTNKKTYLDNSLTEILKGSIPAEYVSAGEPQDPLDLPSCKEPWHRLSFKANKWQCL